MITQVYSKDGSSLLYYGKSTDTKPVKDQNDPTSKDPPNGSVFYEMDTSSAFMFDGEDKEWIKQTGGAIPPGYVKPEGTKEIDANGTGIDVTEYKYVDVNTPQPSGTKQISITQNGTTTENVSKYADAEITVNTLPAKGLIFEDYDTDGFPHSARLVGNYTALPFYYMAGIFRNDIYHLSFGKKITKFIIPDGITFFEQGSFSSNFAITSLTLPHNSINLTTGAMSGNISIEEYHFFGDVVFLFSAGAARQFSESKALKRVLFDGKVDGITSGCFSSCPNIVLYDFSNCTTIPPLYSVASLGHASGCVIRIPAALSDTTLGTGNGWESATNWSALTNIVWEVV